MSRYVALLRGINVGGKNIIKMADLRACFDDEGFEDVSTYIQSGNVVFESRSKAAALQTRIEKLLSDTFDYRANVVIRSRKQMQNVVTKAPKGFGERPKQYRYDVAFLKAPLTSSKAVKGLKTKPGVDTVETGTGVLYFRRLIAKASQSQLSRIAAMPIYQNLTVRNWNTTTKLLRMLDGTDE